MYCQKCGTENPDNAQFCQSCGNLLAAAPVQAGSATVSQAMPAKTSGLAITSFVLGMLSLLCSIFTGLPAIIFGIISLVKISKSKGSLKGTGFAIAGITVPMILLPAILLGMLMPALAKVKTTAERIVCSSNLRGLGTAVMVYANDYDDKFPTADKWCDLLIEHVDVDEKSLQCPTAPPGSYGYAFNRNLAGLQTSEIASDVVMIFETIPDGRNACGGPELLRRDAHGGTPSGGCNILFADGHVAFYRADEIPGLKWTPE